MVVVDPPRAGLQAKRWRTGALGAGRIVYVSCNPTRRVDVAALRAEPARPARVRPVDLFPHTPHVEAVALLTRT